MIKPLKSIFILLIVAFAALAFVNQQKPTLYLTGDSTTRNSDKETWGWGSIIPNYFNLAKINIENHAMAGRSTHGTIKGIGAEEQEIYNPVRKIQEVVHTCGWYMRKYIADIKAKGATPIICSPVPRNFWKEGKFAGHRNKDSYGQWASEIGEETGTYFIDLNKMIADDYETEGKAK